MYIWCSLRYFLLPLKKLLKFLRQFQSFQSSQEGQDFEAKTTWDRIWGRTWDQEAWWKQRGVLQQDESLEETEMIIEVAENHWMDGWMAGNVLWVQRFLFWYKDLFEAKNWYTCWMKLDPKETALESSTCRPEFNSMISYHTLNTICQVFR